MKKKFLTLQTKLILVLLSVIILISLMISTLYFSVNAREKNLMNTVMLTNKTIVNTTLSDFLRQQESVTMDYAAWDDMYTNVQSKNIDWIKTNMATFSNSYGFNYFSIFDSNGVCLFYKPQSKNLIKPDIIKKLDGGRGNFFILEDSILSHVSWSIITFTSDTQRIEKGTGYLFIVRDWDYNFLSNLKARTGFPVNFYNLSSKKDTSTTIYQGLKDIDGKLIKSIGFRTSQLNHKIKQSKEFMFLAVLISMLVVMLTFWLVIRKYVTKPINMILKSLKSRDIRVLEKLGFNRIDDEWDILANLVKDSFEKSKILQEQSKELAQKAQQLNEEILTKDRFFDLIAHDLNSPFNGIMGFSEILLEEGSSYSDEEKENMIKLIYNSSKNAHKLLEHLLEWARLQTGRLKVSPTTFDVSKTINGVISFHFANAMHRKVTLVSTVKESHYVYADEPMVDSTIRNIVSNAIKFTQSGGIVMISVEKHNDSLEIIVTDNGKGMSPDILNALFKIGEKIISEDLTGKKGTGLGLILCKEFVERNGGKIWVESELGKGSKFHFTIPLT
ncbi:MAG: ATP-binding protein [Candidatus Absconditicoccaceae bacterium]